VCCWHWNFFKQFRLVLVTADTYTGSFRAIHHVFTLSSLLMQALVAPASLIAHNAGVEGEVVVEKIKESDWEVGYNAMTDKYEILMEAGVIDPAKVTRCAL
jgi:hypothetical protein